MKKYLSIICLVFFGLTTTSFNQTTDSTYNELIKNFKKDYFTVDLLFQAVADFQPERTIIGNNGFYLSNVRLRMHGNLDKNFSYFFQTSFMVSPILLDASISYRLSDAMHLNAGQFKTPFSKEYLTYAADLDFVNRAQEAALLSPRRDIGLQLSGKFADNLFEYRAGIFNGNGPNKIYNDNNSFLYVGRIALTPHDKNGHYEIALNAGYDGNTTGGVLIKNYFGKRTFLGGDLQAVIDKFLFSAEISMNKFEGKIDSVHIKKEPYGYHITLGYKPFKKHQFLFRYDNLSADGIISDSELYIIGYNFWPTRFAEIQVNYIIDSNNTEFKNHWYLINFQIAI
ncbi:MAG: porin [Ignavibacteriaceae bacterium]|jgi:hypothetical protein